jgi:hypothetical protein
VVDADSMGEDAAEEGPTAVSAGVDYDMACADLHTFGGECCCFLEDAALVGHHSTLRSNSWNESYVLVYYLGAGLDAAFD